MFSNACIAHIGVAVTDIDQSLAFYRDVLGLRPGHGPEERDGATIVSLPFGESEVELLQPRPRTPGFPHGHGRVLPVPGKHVSVPGDHGAKSLSSPCA